MAKHIVRMIITVAILATVGYFAWSYFFTPADDMFVYSQSVKLLTNIESSESSIQKALDELNAQDCYGSQGYKFNNLEEKQREIYNLRLVVFGGLTASQFEGIYGTVAESAAHLAHNGFRENVSLYALNEPLNTAFMYYVPYTKFIKSISDPKLDEMKILFNNFEASSATLKSEIKQIVEYQRGVTNTVLQNNKDVIFNNTKVMYAKLTNTIKEYYANYAKLIDGVRVLVVTNVSDNNFVYETLPIYYNSVVKAVIKFGAMADYTDAQSDFKTLPVSANLMNANKYIYSALMYDKTYKEVVLANADQSSDRLSLITSYNTLAKNYSEILFGVNNMFTFTNKQIYSVINAATGSTEVVIRDGYLTEVQSVLESLGYNKYVAPTEGEE